MNIRRAVVCVLLAACALAPTVQARGLTTGFGNDPVLTDGSASAQSTWIPRAVQAGGSIVRVYVDWSAVAPSSLPATWTAKKTGPVAESNPADPHYRWNSNPDGINYDAVIQQLTSAGLRVLVTVATAPRWAEGPSRPSSCAAGVFPPNCAYPGTWRPSATHLSYFAKALALRYSGTVHLWQPWNEPNIPLFLAPQWSPAGGAARACNYGHETCVPASPYIYRAMLNGFYNSVKFVSSNNYVVNAGTSPFGDAAGSGRMQPVTFDKYLFCLQGDARLSNTSCPHPPHMDALDHHPYPPYPFATNGPTTHARYAGDVSVPDYYELSRLLYAAQRFHTVVPSSGQRLWVTELFWNTAPQKNGVPVNTAGRWYEQAMYILWHQGVDTVLWLQIRDGPPAYPPGYGAGDQHGGLFTYGTDGTDGSPKRPVYTAVYFPFVTQRINSSTIEVWGRAPFGGTLQILKSSHGWKRIYQLSVTRHQVFDFRLALSGSATLAARVNGGGGTSTWSLSWSQGK